MALKRNRISGLQLWAAASVVTFMTISSAQAQTSVGWVWGNQPTATSTYTPDTTYSYNSSGGAVTITPLGTGYYQVDFDNLYNTAHLNNVQVTAYQTSGYCTITEWDADGTNNAAEMYVNCFDINGKPANSYFTLLYQQRTSSFGDADKGMAFLWANEPTEQSYTPSTEYSFNSTGGTNTIVRNGVGNYTVSIPGLPGMHSDAQVTAYNAVARCKVENWEAGGGGALVNVLCFDANGSAADEFFSLAYVVHMPLGKFSAPKSRGAWVLATKDTTAKTYIPKHVFQFSDFRTGGLSATRTGTGSYTITIPGDPIYKRSNMLVTAHGDDSDYCNIYYWSTDTMNVQCYSQDGNIADSQFDMSFQTFK